MNGLAPSALIALLIGLLPPVGLVVVRADPPTEIPSPVAPINQLPDLPLLAAPALKPQPRSPAIKEPQSDSKPKPITPGQKPSADPWAWSKPKPKLESRSSDANFTTTP